MTINGMPLVIVGAIVTMPSLSWIVARR